MSQDEVTTDVGERIAAVADGADLGGVADALARGRAVILSRWLASVARQPFHASRPDAAVADHIPVLFDAIVALLRRLGTSGTDTTAPLDDAAVVAAATAHAAVRFEQGLGPVAVLTEFRLLRQEISRSLVSLLADDTSPSDVVAGLAMVGDALDGAASVGLGALSERVENLREGFLATTMHDIRQPITLVAGSLRLAERWLDRPVLDADRLRESIEDALSASDELVAVIDTLSDASRVAIGAMDPDPEPVSLEGVVREAVSALGASARARVTVVTPRDQGTVGSWDAGLMRRLVSNLLGNALKYSGPDGPVVIEVGPVGPRLARLRIQDQGLGMTPAELEVGFDRFVRADRARRQGIPGLGLGLYACRGIVKAHGGTIRLESAGIGQGTTAIVELPMLATLEDS
jgi:signal transduction histidine kinase